MTPPAVTPPTNANPCATTTARRGTILLVDGHPLTRLGLRAALCKPEGAFTIVGEASEPGSGLALARSLQPAVVVTELEFPEGGAGFDLIRDLRIACPATGVVVYTATEGPAYAERCLRAGASGYVRKSDPLEQILHAVRRAAEGTRYVCDRGVGELLDKLASAARGDPALGLLSAREFEVLHLIGRGLSTATIAAELGRSQKTIETYRCRIKRKLALSNAVQLAQFAARMSDRAPERAGGEPAATPPRRTPIVVVADDHAVVRNPLARLMRYRGIDAREACDGVEALAILEREPVDALVLDLMMPNMSGLEVLGRLRRDRRWTSLPVVVVTGAFDPTLLSEAAAHANAVMIKATFEVDQLIETVTSLFHPSAVAPAALPAAWAARGDA